jgi:hypothetical protein
MAAPTRVYLISPRTVAAGTARECRLVRATHPAHALKHVADTAFSVEVAKQEDLIDLLGLGTKVEDIGPEQRELPAT